VEHLPRNLASLQSRPRCGNVAIGNAQLSGPAEKSMPCTSAPKSVIAFRCRFELFCETALGISEKIEWDAFSL
jgi:hypothetical protein